MDMPTITMDPDEARAQAADYQAMDPSQMTDEDLAVLAGLLSLVEGKPVVDVRQCLVAGGLHDDGTPRLALARADWTWCWLRTNWGRRGLVEFLPQHWPHPRAHTLAYQWPQAAAHHTGLRAMVPPIPPGHRPRRYRLRRHLILFEADQWERVPRPPGDPALLRPIHGDLAVVEHVWDLTPLEQAVLEGRNHGE